MKKILVIAFFTLMFVGYTQPVDFVFRDSILNNRSFHVTSLNTFNSNAIKNDFLGKFIYGGNITNEILDASDPKKFNVIGGEAEQTFNYYEGNLLKNRPNLGILFSASDQHFVSSSYKPAVFNIAFRGNAPYTGDTLDMSYTHGQYLHYQNYGIGVYDKRTQSYVRLGFLVGNRSIHLRTGETYFHTTDDGSKIHLETDFNGFLTNNDSTSTYLSAEGYGVSLELNHHFIFNTKSGKTHVVHFNLSNLGSIFWNGSTRNLSLDTTYSFSGFDYQDIQNVSTYTTDDIVDTLNLNDSHYNRREALPIQIIINKVPIYNMEQKWQSTFGFKAILIPDYRPMIYAGIHYQPTKSLSFASRAIIGGFGGLRFGLNANYWLKDKLYVGLSTLDIVGTSSNTFGKGKSVNLNLQLNL